VQTVRKSVCLKKEAKADNDTDLGDDDGNDYNGGRAKTKAVLFKGKMSGH
jgi:hypothetical protein